MKASSHLGYTVSKEDIKHDKIVGSVSMPSREIFRLQDEVWREWEQLPPTEAGIPEIVLGLRNNGYKVYIATSRPCRSAILVVKWLKKICITYDEFHSLGPYKAKAEIDCDFLVDDSLYQIKRIIDRGKTGLLYQQPWNEKSNILGAARIRSLAEVTLHLT